MSISKGITASNFAPSVPSYSMAFALNCKFFLDCYKVRDEIEYVYMMCYQWKQQEYENTKIKELTPEEKKQFNKNLVDIIAIY